VAAPECRYERSSGQQGCPRGQPHLDQHDPREAWLAEASKAQFVAPLHNVFSASGRLAATSLLGSAGRWWSAAKPQRKAMMHRGLPAPRHAPLGQVLDVVEPHAAPAQHQLPCLPLLRPLPSTPRGGRLLPCLLPSRRLSLRLCFRQLPSCIDQLVGSQQEAGDSIACTLCCSIASQILQGICVVPALASTGIQQRLEKGAWVLDAAHLWPSYMTCKLASLPPRLGSTNLNSA
jgi:hypothetical protein